MANDIILPLGQTGISGLTIRLLSGTTLGSSISLSEIGTSGLYTNNSNLTGLTENSEYVIFAYNSSNQLIANTETVLWDGSTFINPDFKTKEVHEYLGLDSSNPVTIDKTGTTVTEVSANISVTHTINEVNETVVKQRS